MRLTDGAVYNSEQVKRSKQEINNLGYFEKVNINTSPGSKDNLIKLHIEVTERPTGSFSVGAGYSSVDSVVGMFQISQNNLFGKGQRLKLMAQIGGDSSQFDISFTEPWFMDTRVSVGFDLFLIDRDYYDFKRKSYGFNLRAGFPLDHKFDYTRLYLTYRLEDTDIEVDCRGISEDDYYDKDCGDVPLSILEQEGRTITSSITTSIVRDSRDDRWSPRMGSNSSLSLELAGFGGDAKFIGIIASSAKYFPLPFDTAFMVRGEIGQLFEAGEDIPIGEKFFLGGLDSLRGFDSRSVGPMEKELRSINRPDDESDYDVVGGEKELFFNFEFLFPIMPGSGVRGVVFFDVGNAYKTNDDFFSDLRTDAGVGINWYSPFGPLRLVWGVNLDPEDKYDEDSSNFEFSMGQMF
jgi:outer membrane protein insertion porin family